MDKETIEAILDKIDEGFCHDCEHYCEGCHKECGKEGWEKETFIEWLKEQV